MPTRAPFDHLGERLVKQLAIYFVESRLFIVVTPQVFWNVSNNHIQGIEQARA
jgi:hypothetical protein